MKSRIHYIENVILRSTEDCSVALQGRRVLGRRGAPHDNMRPGCRRGCSIPTRAGSRSAPSSFVSFWYDGGPQTSISGPPAYPGHVNLRVQCAHERHTPCLLRLASMQVRNPSTPSGQEAPPTSSPDSRIPPEDFHPGPAATRRLSWRSPGMPRVRLLRTRTAPAMTLPFHFHDHDSAREERRAGQIRRERGGPDRRRHGAGPGCHAREEDHEAHKGRFHPQPRGRDRRSGRRGAPCR